MAARSASDSTPAAGSGPAAGPRSSSYRTSTGLAAGQSTSSDEVTARPILRSQAAFGVRPRVSACRRIDSTTLARTRSRPTAYGSDSRRVSSTKRRSSSSYTRHR
ncbi:hypothetical protein ABGB14_16475 [Nonomuraea sp. B10E15]|uniref:hypothetical protein n=1 Tax=Nonomuraea sp. B10E15 TaxID=3153560 RepID=UPI00325CBA37